MFLKGPFTYYIIKGGGDLLIFVTKFDKVGGFFLECNVTFFEQLEA